MPETDSRKKNRILSITFPVMALGCLLLAVVLTVGAVTGDSRLLAFFESGDQMLTNEEVLERVGQLTELPLVGEPIVATVEDVDRLTEQDGFYVGASPGDKIIVYPTNNRAIIYDVAQDKLIKDGTIEGTFE